MPGQCSGPAASLPRQPCLARDRTSHRHITHTHLRSHTGSIKPSGLPRACEQAPRFANVTALCIVFAARLCMPWMPVGGTAASHPPPHSAWRTELARPLLPCSICLGLSPQFPLPRIPQNHQMSSISSFSSCASRSKTASNHHLQPLPPPSSSSSSCSRHHIDRTMDIPVSAIGKGPISLPLKCDVPIHIAVTIPFSLLMKDFDPNTTPAPEWERPRSWLGTLLFGRRWETIPYASSMANLLASPTLYDRVWPQLSTILWARGAFPVLPHHL